MKTIKRIYLAGLISMNEKGERANALEFLENIRLGQKSSLDLIKMGYAVFDPFQDYQYALLEDKQMTASQYKANSMAWLEVSDAVVVISGMGLGGGVDAEIARAKELGIPVYGFEFMEKWHVV